MADSISYSTVPGKLPDLLKKVRDTGVPPKVTNAWLETVGFKSTNDRSMLAVLRQIGFIDQSGVPTPAWKEYRGNDYKAVLGRAIQSGYQDLYSVYPDAHNRDNSELSHVFTTKTTAGKQTVDKMVSTFKSLAGVAEFTSKPAPAQQMITSDPTTTTPNTSTVVTGSTTTPSGLSVNINVQLTLPETTDEKVYQAFFKAMRNHLLTDTK